jgi:DNA-binding LacI/PurR family transcriptional regulator
MAKSQPARKGSQGGRNGASPRVTLQDVGDLAGVDLSTASRLLRNHTAGYREETIQRVRQAAETLGYRTNAQARALRLGRQQAIAMLVPDLDNFGFTQVVRGVQEVCDDNDFILLVSEVKDRPNHPHLGLEGRVDGILVAFATVDDPGVNAWLSTTGLPTVLVQRGSPQARASVVFDEEKNAAAMVDYLASLGHRDIAHVSGSLRTDTALRRYRGFDGALAAHGLVTDPRWRADGDFTFEGGRAATFDIIRGSKAVPTALAVDSLVSAVGALSALHELGLRVPADISVIAIDEHPVATQTTPPLTTVKLQQRVLGHRAAEMLLAMIDGEEGSAVIVATEATVIERESTAPPRTTDVSLPAALAKESVAASA